MSRCPICKTQMVQPATGRRRKVCSDKCRVAAHRMKLRFSVVQPSASSTDGASAGGGDVLASTAATGSKE